MIVENAPDLSTELASIILLLRGVQSQSADPSLAIKQVAWILPLIKNPANLNLLLTEVSATASSIVATVDRALLFTDVISSATSHKQKVSHPTISFAEWLSIVLGWAYHPGTPALLALCVASGIVRILQDTNMEAQKLCVASAKQIAYHSGDAGEVAATVACLTRAQWGLSEQSKQQLPASKLLKPTLLAVYSGPDALNPDRPLFAVEFGAYSRFIATLVANPQLSVPDLLKFVETVDIYARHANAMWPIESTKKLLFGVGVQFEGVSTRLLYEKEPFLAGKLLLALQPMGAVIESTGRFDSLMFVEAVITDTLLSAGPGAADNVAEALAAPFQYGLAPNMLGQLLYMLETVEQMRQALSPLARHNLLLVAQQFLVPPFQLDSLSRAVFEASHSLVLALLGNEAAGASYEYLATILRLYPGELFTYAQFCTALDGVTAAVLEDRNRQRVLMALFDKAKSIMPGIPIADPRQGPPTQRSAVLGGFIRALPTLCEPPEFASWLNKLEAAIPHLGYQPTVTKERTWLVKEIESMVGNLNLELADIGIRWWFTFSRQSHL